MAYRDVVIADSPVGYYRLQEPSGTVMANEMGVAGAYAGSPLLNQPGPYVGSKAVKFFSPSANASFTAGSIAAGSSVTVEYWLLSTPADNGSNGAFSIGGLDFPSRCGAHSPYLDNMLYFDYGNTSVGRVQIDYTPYLSTWVLIHLTFDLATSKHAISLNGVEVASSINASAPAVILNGGTIGVAPGMGNMNGAMSEFAYYNVALTPAQRLAHFNATTQSPTQQLQSFRRRRRIYRERRYQYA